MISLNVKHNIKEFTKYLTDIEKKQIPMASAEGLTKTAQAAQEAIQNRIQSIFNNRKKWWVKGSPIGIRIISAKKNKLIAIVYTKASFANLQEDGGTKRPTRSKSLLIPTDNTPKNARKAGGAAQVLRNNNVFSDKRGIFKRTGGKKRKNQKLVILFHRDKTANIKPLLEFMSTAYKTASNTFEGNFYRALSKALQTAR